MAFLPGLFGGDNQVGFFGGGRFRPDQASFEMPQYGAMNFRYAEGGSGVAQDALGRYDPLAQQNQERGQQQQLIGNLFGTMNGQTPSVAQQQLQQTTQGNVANAYAMAQSGRYNPAAARMAANNAASVNQQAAGQGALLRAQETQNAQGMLGNVLGGARAQDQGLYGTLNQTALGYLNGQQNLNAQQMQANMSRQQMEQQGFAGAQQNAVGGKLLNAAAGVAGGMAGMGAFGGGGGGGAPQQPQYQGYSVAPQLMHAKGGEVPGYAKGGDSLKNDTVPALLSPGEVVLPRSITLKEDAPEKARLFVEAIQRKRAGGGGARRAA